MITSRAAARANIAAWERVAEGGGLDAVVVNTSGCGTTVKDYGFLFAGDTEWAGRAARIAALARDVSEVMAELSRLAVARNRARRRLKALAGELLPAAGRPGYDYVLIARGETLRRPYIELAGDLETALMRLASGPGAKPGLRSGGKDRSGGRQRRGDRRRGERSGRGNSSKREQKRDREHP